MPECSEIGLVLGAAGDGELEPNDLREVAGHLRACVSCAAELSDYSTIGRELRAIAVVPSLENFTKSVLKLIEKLAVVAILAIALRSILLAPSTTRVAHPMPDAVASSQTASPSVARPAGLVDVSVDTAFGDASFDSFSHTNGRTQSGKMIVFSLPGGRTLHVQPRAMADDTIAMEVVLFDGGQTAMTADLTLKSGDTFALSGEQGGHGALLIRIRTSTAGQASRGPDYSDRSSGSRIAKAS